MRDQIHYLFCMWFTVEEAIIFMKDATKKEIEESCFNDYFEKCILYWTSLWFISTVYLKKVIEREYMHRNRAELIRFYLVQFTNSTNLLVIGRTMTKFADGGSVSACSFWVWLCDGENVLPQKLFYSIHLNSISD